MGYNYDDMIEESRDSYAKAYTDIATAALLGGAIKTPLEMPLDLDPDGDCDSPPETAQLPT